MCQEWTFYRHLIPIERFLGEKSLVLLLMLLMAFNLFFNLGVAPIDNWDEARHGVNAHEMGRNHDYLVHTYAQAPDYYNLKPPLSYWAIALGYKLVGANPWGLRLFSGLAALGTILLVFCFVRRTHGKLAALLSASILATTCQYILFHGARSGDADSLFVFFFTLAMLALTRVEEHPRWFSLVGLGFSLAFLCKSWHAGPILAVVGVYLLVRRMRLPLSAWGGFFTASLLPLLAWGALRYSRDGMRFFQAMVDYDLLKRTATPLEGHVGSLWYYLLVAKGNYLYWLLFLSLALLLHRLVLRERLVLPPLLPILLWLGVPFLLFTVAQTKLAWYILPLYPAVAILLGTLFSRLIKHANGALRGFLVLGVIACLLKNEGSIILRLLQVPRDDPQETIGRLVSLPHYRGATIFTMCGTYGGPSHWDQSHLLCAELYGELRPQPGGVEAFLREPGSLLLAPKGLDLSGVRVLLEGRTSVLLAHR